MGRNWFEAYCEKHRKGFWVLIGNPPRCPDCVLEVKEREMSIKIEAVGESENTVIIKPGGEREG